MTGTGSRILSAVAALALCSVGSVAEAKQGEREKVGVIFAVHGGFDTYSDLNVFDTAVQQFSYDPNHFIYKMAIWNPSFWGMIVSSPDSKKQTGKYSWEYARVGGLDPFNLIVDQQVKDLQKALTPISARNNIDFEVDMAAWMTAGEYLDHYPYPRYIYHSKSKMFPTVKMTYCGEKEPGRNGQPWDNCNPQRYDVDGPFERLAAKGVSRIFIVDLTVGGVRFVKTFQVYQMGKLALADWAKSHGTNPIPVSWLNDPNDLMVRSYPVAPAGWTASLGMPTQDVSVPLEGNPNPISEDPDLINANTDGIAAAFNPAVELSETGIIMLNHAMTPNNEVFDPKINDTLALDAAIEADLLKRFPGLNPENIVGAFVGRPEINPVNGRFEPVRSQRGDENGDNFLYEEDKKEPTPQYGYRYWEALDFLRLRGVKHIVIGFPQISAESVLNMVEIPNQIAKEVGFKAWRPLDVERSFFPGYGDPFAPYWGIWISPMSCGATPCCFEMGGCSDGRPYPPPRQAPLNTTMTAMDPSLAYDVCEYGHLGYDPTLGSPNPAQPIQGQYRGTWSMYRPPNNDHKLIKMMARHIEKATREAGLGNKAD